MMTKKFLLLVLICSLFLVVTPVTAQESIFDETKTIENGKMWYITANLIADQSYELSLSVESGNAIDLLVMDETNFDIYKDGFTAGDPAIYTYYTDYSALNIKSETYSVTFDTDIKLYFVVENADSLVLSSFGNIRRIN